MFYDVYVPKKYMLISMKVLIICAEYYACRSIQVTFGMCRLHDKPPIGLLYKIKLDKTTQFLKCSLHSNFIMYYFKLNTMGKLLKNNIY